MFDEEESKLILGLPVSLVGCGDRVIWHYAKNGEYTVRTGYGVAMEMQENGEFVVRVNLIRRRMQVDGRCMMCGEAEEKDHHLFFDCEFSWVMWQDELLQEGIYLMWRIWKCRNDMVFKGVSANPMKMIDVVRQQVVELRVHATT
ncbi:hypothetical protein ACFX2B_011831 [Malus domestica]